MRQREGSCSICASMASLLFPLVALAASSCAVLVLGASATTPRQPAVYLVGGAEGWTVLPRNANDSLNRWAMRHRFHVGDVLDFKYSNDSVLLVRRADYDGCSAASPVRRFVAGGGHTRFRLDRLGLFFFIGGVPARCEAGQRMVVRVADSSSLGSSGAPTPTPTPAPAPAPEAETSYRAPPSGDRPIPVALKLFVPALLGFLGGCFFAGVLLWLCLCI